VRDVPIREHAFLSDCGTSALVTKGVGRLDVQPRFDGQSVLGRLLDREAGHFSIRPMDESAEVRWAHRRASLVLDTVWTTASGRVVVTAVLALGGHERGHELGPSTHSIRRSSTSGEGSPVFCRHDLTPTGSVSPSTRSAVIADLPYCHPLARGSSMDAHGRRGHGRSARRHCSSAGAGLTQFRPSSTGL
jgi:hypothetical protein